jgi:hypothetical protein
LSGVTAVLGRDDQRNVIRKAGTGIVLSTGDVRAANSIRVALPLAPHKPLEWV